MAKKKRKSRFDKLAASHWSVPLALMVVVCVALRTAPSWVPALAAGYPLLAGLAPGVAHALHQLTWLALIVLGGATFFAFLATRQRGRLLDTQASLASIRALSWQEFERVVGEAYRRLGWRVQETGQGGADGGVDLLLKKGRETVLVQCKRWKQSSVPVTTVREMWGLAEHHKASGVKIVCVGEFTADAEAFAKGKPLELVSGEKLLRLVRSVQRSGVARTAPESVPASAATRTPPARARRLPDNPECPQCNGAMVRRANRATGDKFWGCKSYPACRGSLTD